MKLVRIYKRGKVINQDLYNQLQQLDEIKFPGAGNEFIGQSRDWWVIESGNVIVAYCGCWYKDGVCMLNRAWVHQDYRRRGIQKKMIRTRVESAKEVGCSCVITYTAFGGHISSNNLIKCKFFLYSPIHKFSGLENALYWRREL